MCGAGLSGLVEDDGPEITPNSYCEKHRILYELDEIDGSTDDLLDDEESCEER